MARALTELIQAMSVPFLSWRNHRVSLFHSRHGIAAALWHGQHRAFPRLRSDCGCHRSLRTVRICDKAGDDDTQGHRDRRDEVVLPQIEVLRLGPLL